MNQSGKDRLICISSNGMNVWLTPQSAHAKTHLEDHPQLLSVVKEVIPTLTLTELKVRTEIDTGKIVGMSDLVETNDTDDILYAKRIARQSYSRFVKNKTPLPTSWVTLDLRRINESNYYLYTCFIGRLTPSFPGGDFRPDESLEFWSKHALVWGTQQVEENTITKNCPW